MPCVAPSSNSHRLLLRPATLHRDLVVALCFYEIRNDVGTVIPRTIHQFLLITNQYLVNAIFSGEATILWPSRFVAKFCIVIDTVGLLRVSPSIEIYLTLN